MGLRIDKPHVEITGSLGHLFESNGRYVTTIIMIGLQPDKHIPVYEPRKEKAKRKEERKKMLELLGEHAFKTSKRKGHERKMEGTT